MKEFYRTKKLVGDTKLGKQKFWQGAAFCNEKSDLLGTTIEAFYETYSWIGEDGKMKSSGIVKVERKNVGKANETSESEQAINELESMLRKKLDEGYNYEDGSDSGIVRYPLPMLAKTFEDAEHTIEYPIMMQYKYNGVRCMHNGNRFWSRKNKEYTVFPHLTIDTKGVIVDGEVMLPPPYTWQQTASTVKRKQPLSEKLIYIIYDMYDEKNPNMTFSERLDFIKTLDLPELVQIAPTETAENEQQILDFHKRANDLGYEGTIIRNPNGIYLHGLKRSSDLIKLKDFKDDEFEITGFVDGKGNEEGAIVFTCKTSDGKTFNVRPCETIKERKSMFLKGNTYIGKKYTVRFQCYTDNGIPNFPTGIGVRDYE
jgi:DNA ligase-1